MPKKAGPEALLAIVQSARGDPGSEASLFDLRVVLKSREARAIAKAATLAAAHDLTALVPDLRGAFERLLAAPCKSDPGCVAKAALAEALDRLGHDDRHLFRQAIRVVQMEPVWGGREDTAADLRAAAAMALARLDPHEAPLELARLLADPVPAARMASARALAYRGRADGLPLLHLRILAGDPAPAVLGECFEAALRLGPASSLDLVVSFLDAPDAAVAEEAATALGRSRLETALPHLREWCGRVVDAARREAGLRAIALLRREDALDFLLERIREGTTAAAQEAVRALGVLRGDEALASRVQAVVTARGEAAVAKEWSAK